MRLLFFLTICLAGPLVAQPAGSNSLVTPDLVWTASTRDWPSSLWVYKVVPQHFSPAIISNLLEMAEFKMADNKGTNGGWLLDWNDLNFETPDEKRHLWICEKYGYIEYKDDRAEAGTLKLSVGVPTDEEAYILGLDYLRKFGIDRSQLATKPSTNVVYGPNDLGCRRDVETQGWTDKITHKEVDDVCRRGIYFVRRLDGVDIDGIVHGGMYIAFGDHAKVCELKITWRGLEPFDLRPTLAPAQILDLIWQGHAKWRPSAPNPKDVTRITVSGFQPFYRGQPGNADLEKQQRYVEPYVVVYASLDGSTNATLYSELPIVSNK